MLILHVKTQCIANGVYLKRYFKRTIMKTNLRTWLSHDSPTATRPCFCSSLALNYTQTSFFLQETSQWYETFAKRWMAHFVCNFIKTSNWSLFGDIFIFEIWNSHNLFCKLFYESAVLFTLLDQPNHRTDTIACFKDGGIFVLNIKQLLLVSNEYAYFINIHKWDDYWLWRKYSLFALCYINGWGYWCLSIWNSCNTNIQG